MHRKISEMRPEIAEVAEAFRALFGHQNALESTKIGKREHTSD